MFVWNYVRIMVYIYINKQQNNAFYFCIFDNTNNQYISDICMYPTLMCLMRGCFINVLFEIVCYTNAASC